MKLLWDNELMSELIEFRGAKLQDEKEKLGKENEVLRKELENMQDQDQSLLIGAFTKLKGGFAARFCISLVLLYSMILPLQKIKNYPTFSGIPPLEYCLHIVQVATFFLLSMVRFGKSGEFMDFKMFYQWHKSNIYKLQKEIEKYELMNGKLQEALDHERNTNTILKMRNQNAF